MASIETWVTAQEAAEIIGVTAGRVRQLIARDQIPSILVGNLRLLERKTVERFAKIPRHGGGRPRKKI